MLGAGKRGLIAVYLSSNVFVAVGIYSDVDSFLCLSPLRRRLQLMCIPSASFSTAVVEVPGVQRWAHSVPAFSTEVIRSVIYPPLET